MVRGGGLNFFKVDENGRRSEIFARKGGIRQNGEGGYHIILRFFWRFLMMQHEKMYFSVFC